MLEIMERLESSQSRSSELAAQQEAARARVAALTASRDTTTGEIDAETEKLQAQRATQAGLAGRGPGRAVREDPRAAGRRRRRRAAPAPVRRLPARAQQRRDQRAARRRPRRGHALRRVPPHPGAHGRVRAVTPVRRRGRRRVPRQPGPGRLRHRRQGRARPARCCARRAEHIGTASNNVAEYRGLIAGLEAVRELDPTATVEARLDSKLVVEQLSGRWKIKHPDMRVLALRAREVLPPSQVTYTWVPRERNKHADRLANEALDAAARGRGLVARRQHRRAATRQDAARRRGRRAGGAARPAGRLGRRARHADHDGAAPARRDAAHGGEAVQRGRRGGPRALRRRASRQAAAVAERLARYRRRRRHPRVADAPDPADRRRGRRGALGADVREVDAFRGVRVRRVGGADVRRGPRGLAGGARRLAG